MNQLVIVLIIVLLPGIVATVLCDKLTTHSKWDSFKFGLYSLVLGLFTYSIVQLIFYIYSYITNVDFSQSIGISPAAWHHLDVWKFAYEIKPKINPIEICIALFMSPFVALFATIVVNYKLINKFAGYLGITTKYGDENLFSYYLNSKEIDWIYVRDIENNLTYQGRVLSYSENDKIQELVLYEVSVYSYDDSEFSYSLPTIYLSKGLGEFIIEEIPKDLLKEENGEQTENKE